MRRREICNVARRRGEICNAEFELWEKNGHTADVPGKHVSAMESSAFSTEEFCGSLAQ